MEHHHKWQYLPMEIKVPQLSLIVFVGPSGAGKSTFAKTHFLPQEVVSSDTCRGIVSNDENNQAATQDAFDLLHYIVRKRLKNGLLTVVDATNVQSDSRKQLVAIAKEYHVLPVCIVLDMPHRLCQDRNATRADRNFGGRVIRMQQQQLRKNFRNIKKEGFRFVYSFKTAEEVASVTGIVRDRLYNDKKEFTGPFDIIGDIHGCADELKELLKKLGYQIEAVPEAAGNYGLQVHHPEGRQVIFVGDLVDRGPASSTVLKYAMSMVNSGAAHCVPGNHDIKLLKKLQGKNVNLKHGLAETLEQLASESQEFHEEVKVFLKSLISHYLFDNGKLVVAHAGLKEHMHGRASGAIRSFCLYGETTGETDEFGLPERLNWAADYKGRAKVVYGHTPVFRAQWFNNTIDIDTGCVFGGALTALRYPENELVSVQARQEYCAPAKPLSALKEEGMSAQHAHDDLLNIEDLIGKRIVHTRLRDNITLTDESSIAALEVMSRFAVNPKWLIYLPPTMSPSETSALPGYLEHPAQAIDYYAEQGVEQLICEEKHMGSRAILVLCKDEETAFARFGIEDEGFGICYTRTGRNFFNDQALEKAFLERVRNALSASNFWEQHQTQWVCLDAELMPWSAKAQGLLQDQYAAVGAAASNALVEVAESLEQAKSRGIDTDTLLESTAQKQEAVGNFQKAYRHYCWNVESIDDYKLAPFHILATEGEVHVNKSHEWHMRQIAQICKSDTALLCATPYKIVDTNSEASIQEAVDWWHALTQKGGEGMVVKPMQFVAQGEKGILQPAIKSRGSEYLRIIYGPEYDSEKHLERLKSRSLRRKRSMAFREFALGIEALERFVAKEPLRRVHECVFGVLAMETEDVDPRL